VESIYDPMEEKTSPHATDYDLPDEVKHMYERRPRRDLRRETPLPQTAK
jgi:hypothetical protein